MHPAAFPILLFLCLWLAGWAEIYVAAQVCLAYKGITAYRAGLVQRIL